MRIISRKLNDIYDINKRDNYAKSDVTSPEYRSHSLIYSVMNPRTHIVNQCMLK